MLIGESCENGICRKIISNETMTASFKNLGIQCVKKKDIRKALSERSRIGVDPYDSKDCSIPTALNFLK